MNSKISFDFDFKYIYLLYFFIANFAFFSYNNYQSQLFKNIYSKIFNNFIYGIISLILYFIMIKFSKYSTKKKNRHKKKILYPILFMFLLAFIDEIYTSYLIEQYKDTFYDYSSFCLLSIIPFSYFFFKKKIFLHHQLSIILMFISTIIIIIFYKKDYIQIILSILYFIIFGFEMSVFKYCMEYYFINVYIVCLNQSIAAIIFNLLNIIYNLLISQKINLTDEFWELISNPFRFLLIAILYVCNFMSLKLGIFYLTPSHCMVGISLQCIIFFLFNKEYEKYSNTYFFIIAIIIRFIFEIFSLLIYNEIIILNFCGLAENTRKNIIIRENKEKEKISEIVISDQSDTELDNSTYSDEK